MTGIHTEKLGLSDSRALMETHQQPRNSACLLYTAEQGGVLFYIAKQRGRFIIYNLRKGGYCRGAVIRKEEAVVDSLCMH